MVAACLLVWGCGGRSSEPRAVSAQAAPSGPVTWSATTRLSTGVEVSAPELGIADSGAALAAFSQSPSFEAQTSDLLLAAAPPGKPFDAASLYAKNALSPAVAVRPDGRAAIAYLPAFEDENRESREVMLARGSVDGQFGAPVALGRRASYLAGIALAPDGTVVLVSGTYRRGKAGNTVEMQAIPPTGRPGRVRSLGDLGPPRAGSLALDPDGTVALFFVHRPRVRLAVLSPAGRFRVSTALRGGNLADPQVALGPRERIAVVATAVRDEGEGAFAGGVVVAERRPGARHFDRSVRAPVTPRKEPYAFYPTVAFDADGGRTVAWIQDAKRSDPDGDAVGESTGASFAWTGGRPFLVDRTSREITLTGTARGVLALTDQGSWVAHLVGRGAVTRVRAPSGDGSGVGYSSNRRLATGGGRVAFTWLSGSDTGAQAAIGSLKP